ncbi:MAG: T9SS type A sorting domain-containing protein [Caldithrix sp.]|nr:T9SS type A sorting domain-containing protein [Caldithrix sp.]
MKFFISIICIFVFSFSPALPQSNYDILLDIRYESYVKFDYSYEEFDQYAYLDSSITLTSFKGEIIVWIDSIGFYSDSVKYFLHINKNGVETKRTFFDTISEVEKKLWMFDTITERYCKNSNGAMNKIHGWLFPDTLLKSVDDSSDQVSIYPYSNIFRFNQPSLDDSLFTIDDTLMIHYRPVTVNFNDSYYSIDYYIPNHKGLYKYSKTYSYFGAGFYEKYVWKGVGLIGIDEQNTIPSNIVNLSQNYPNPFNPKTTIELSIVKPGHASLIVYNQLGQEVTKLLNGYLNIGIHKIEFDAQNLSSGLYYYVLTSGVYKQTRKMLLLK